MTNLALDRTDAAVPASPTFDRTDRLVTGLCGLVGAVLSVAMVGLYFVYAGPPPLANVLSRTLLAVTTFTLFLIFAVGLHRMLAAARRGDPGLSGAVCTTALTSYVVVTLVSASVEAGTSLWHPDGSMDPTVDGPLSAATVLLHGPIARLLVAMFLVALSIAARGGILPGWVRVGNAVLALANLALVPSLFFGMDPAHFYAANGWGSTASIGAVNVIWFGVISVAVLRSRRSR